MTVAATVFRLYPEKFPGPLGISLWERALERSLAFGLASGSIGHENTR